MRRAFLATLLFGAALLSPTSIPTVAAIDTLILTVPVYSTSGHPTVLQQLTVNVAAGSQEFVSHGFNLAIGVHTWGTSAPTNIGTTTSIRCVRSADGLVRQSHFGVNLIPGDTKWRPTVRLLLDQPGTYTCQLQLDAYSSAPAIQGIRVGAYALGGGTWNLRATGPYTGGAQWQYSTLPGTGLEPGQYFRYMASVRMIPRTRSFWTLIADGEMSYCHGGPNDYAPCLPGTHAYGYSDVWTRIEVVPLYADGATPCGSALYSSWASARIVAARHHLTMINALQYTAAQLQDPSLFPTQCPLARIATLVYAIGNRILVHGGESFAHSISIS